MYVSLVFTKLENEKLFVCLMKNYTNDTLYMKIIFKKDL